MESAGYRPITSVDSNNDAIIESIENEEEIIDDSEERELVTESCSTKVLETAEEPRDRYRIVYFLFLLFGVTSLVPYNFLITANDVSEFEILNSERGDSHLMVFIY